MRIHKSIKLQFTTLIHTIQLGYIASHLQGYTNN